MLLSLNQEQIDPMQLYLILTESPNPVLLNTWYHTCYSHVLAVWCHIHVYQVLFFVPTWWRVTSERGVVIFLVGVHTLNH